MPRDSHSKQELAIVNGHDPVRDHAVNLAAPSLETPWTGEEEADFEALQAPSALRPKTSLVSHDSKVLVRKPRKQEYVRVHSQEAYRGSYALIQDERNRESLYVVSPSMYDTLTGEYRIHLVVTAISNVDAEVFLWPLAMAESDGRTYEWWESAISVAHQAESEWVRVKTTKNNYYASPPYIAIPDPVWPETPFQELFSRGFKGKVIGSIDHPFVKRLQGGN